MHKKCTCFSWKFPVENPMAWLLQSIHKNSYRAFAHFSPFFKTFQWKMHLDPQAACINLPQREMHLDPQAACLNLSQREMHLDPQTAFLNLSQCEMHLDLQTAG